MTEKLANVWRSVWMRLCGVAARLQAHLAGEARVIRGLLYLGIAILAAGSALIWHGQEVTKDHQVALVAEQARQATDTQLLLQYYDCAATVHRSDGNRQQWQDWAARLQAGFDAITQSFPAFADSPLANVASGSDADLDNNLPQRNIAECDKYLVGMSAKARASVIP